MVLFFKISVDSVMFRNTRTNFITEKLFRSGNFRIKSDGFIKK
jgi:hypothetical protein